MKFFGKAYKVFASQTHIEKVQKVIRGDSVVELALRTQVHLVFPTSRALIYIFMKVLLVFFKGYE